MKDKDAFVQFLREEFPEGQLVSGDREYQCRCRFCGDSRTNQYKMRFYISLDDPSGLVLYHCFNCGVGGVLTPKVLNMISSVPPKILMSLASNNQNKSHVIKMMDSVVYNLRKEPIIDNETTRAKLDYFNKRLGIYASLQDMVNNKLVLSLDSLVRVNNLQYNAKSEVIRELDTNFIGAITISNTLVYLRAITDQTQLYKHFKYVLVPKIGINRYYAIPTASNLEKRVRINIAEGIFDINSVFFNLRECNRDNEIYISCGSQSYLPCIKRLLIDYGLLDCEFHLYLDNDVPERLITRIKNTCKPIGLTVYGHHNLYPGEKDYGVPYNRIQDTQYTITRTFD